MTNPTALFTPAFTSSTEIVGMAVGQPPRQTGVARGLDIVRHYQCCGGKAVLTQDADGWRDSCLVRDDGRIHHCPTFWLIPSLAERCPEVGSSSIGLRICESQ